MKKVLFVATVVRGHIDVFHLPYLKMFKDNDWETTVVAKNNFKNREDCKIPYCDHFYDVPFERNPIKFKNLSAFFKLKKILNDNTYDIIHCHTPVGGVIARLAAKNQKNTKVIYTAHGFHFFQGASRKNWLLFYPIEKYLSKFTDVIVTMNNEDFNIVNQKFKPKKSVKVPGIGIDLSKFKIKTIEEKNILREKNGFSKDDFILIYVGELSFRKNQKQLIEVTEKLNPKIENLKVLIVGIGQDEEYLKKVVDDKQLLNVVEFLGYRTDISDLMNLSNIVVSTSRQEGLPVNLMEGLAVGKPIVATNCRGNRDLVVSQKNGYISDVSDVETMVNNILDIYTCSENEFLFGQESLIESKKYDIKNVLEIMKDIYFL